jgi:hypothetical protein
MRGPPGVPMVARALIEGEPSRPGLFQARHRLWGQLVVTPVAWRSPRLARGLGGGLWPGAESRPGLRVTLLRHGIQPMREPMVPAAWRGRGRRRLAEGRPEAPMPLGTRPSPRLPSTGAPITPHGPPDAFESRCPLSTASPPCWPCVRAPLMMSRAALVASRPAFTARPSAHTETPSTASRRRWVQPAAAGGHGACSRPRAAGESGAASPPRPRRARAKSPTASPCRERWGRRSPPWRVRRVYKGTTRLTHRAPSPRTRGRRLVMVPLGKLRPRG